MKKLILIISLLITTMTSLSAQGFRRHGVALGADRDTLLYIIASPFDNWWINFSGDIQTFIGNTPDPQAQWNTGNLGAGIEIGKWIIPDVAISMRFNAFHVNSKSRHGGNNPWTDIRNPINYDGAELGPYYPISVDGISALGLVIFDWTNFLNGYEAGRRQKVHFYTPIGLGITWLYGKTINLNYVNRTQDSDNPVNMGEYVWNKELAFTGGIMLEYIMSKHISINLGASGRFSRGSIDDYNYSINTGVRRVDWIPSVSMGLKLNLFKNVTKYNPYTKKSHKEKVNHEFLSFGTRTTVSTLSGRIANLNSQIDSIENQAKERTSADSVKLANMKNEVNVLQVQLDSVRAAGDRTPANVLEELLSVNEILNLPAAIIYFQLDRYEIDYNGSKRLQNFAVELNNQEDTLEYFVIGAADSATGSIRHNKWLSERRCEAAYNMLVNNFDVSGNQLLMVPVGGITEYEPQENNRMALIILRTKETEDIINRWLKKK